MLNYIKKEIESSSDLFEVTMPSAIVSISGAIVGGGILHDVLHVSVATLLAIYFLGFLVIYITTAFFKTEDKSMTNIFIGWSFLWPGFIVTCIGIEIITLLWSGQRKIFNLHQIISKSLVKKSKPVVVEQTPVVDNGAYRTSASCSSCDRPL